MDPYGNELFCQKQRILTSKPGAYGQTLFVPTQELQVKFYSDRANRLERTALTGLEWQILAEGIVLDQELIAQCRSGEI